MNTNRPPQVVSLRSPDGCISGMSIWCGLSFRESGTGPVQSEMPDSRDSIIPRPPLKAIARRGRRPVKANTGHFCISSHFLQFFAFYHIPESSRRQYFWNRRFAINLQSASDMTKGPGKNPNPLIFLVPGAGLEPARGYAPTDFKSVASADSAIPAWSNLPSRPIGKRIRHQHQEYLGETVMSRSRHRSVKI